MINIFKKVLLLALALSLPLSGMAAQTGQTKQQGQKDSGNQKAEPAATSKKTSAVNESCDGALNIVPTKSMTFARKRRPARSETKNDSKTETGKDPAPAPAKEGKAEERGPGAQR